MRTDGVPAERLLVVQGDLDFPFGVIRWTRGGGRGGHHGARAVSEAWEPRLRSARLVVLGLNSAQTEPHTADA
ncbi:hypothetical protein ACWGCW_01705 [Streptomyces sp. NPDC054933]